MTLILKDGKFSRSSGNEDYDVLADGNVVGRMIQRMQLPHGGGSLTQAPPLQSRPR